MEDMSLERATKKIIVREMEGKEQEEDLDLSGLTILNNHTAMHCTY